MPLARRHDARCATSRPATRSCSRTEARAGRRRVVLRARHRQQRGHGRAERVDRTSTSCTSGRTRTSTASGRAAAVAAAAEAGPAGRRRPALAEAARHHRRRRSRRSRDSALTDKKSLDENLATLRLSQQRLREQTEPAREPARRARHRDSPTATGRRSREILPKAAARDGHGREEADAGIAGARRSSRSSARCSNCSAPKPCSARSRSRMGGGGGGGGGGGSKTDAKDLADIFELQKDKLRNQYETVQRGQQQQQQQQQADNQVDETAEKLRAARRARSSRRTSARARKADSLCRRWVSRARPAGRGSATSRSRRKTQARQARASRARAAVAVAGRRRAPAPGRGGRHASRRGERKPKVG